MGTRYVLVYWCNNTKKNGKKITCLVINCNDEKVHKKVNYTSHVKNNLQNNINISK